jgi:hypothetical protein
MKLIVGDNSMEAATEVFICMKTITIKSEVNRRKCREKNPINFMSNKLVNFICAKKYI